MVISLGETKKSLESTKMQLDLTRFGEIFTKSCRAIAGFGQIRCISCKKSLDLAKNVVENLEI